MVATENASFHMPEWQTTFQADRMFLVIAAKALKRAELAWPRVEKAQKRIAELLSLQDRTKNRRGDNPERGDGDLEKIELELGEYAESELAEALTPFIPECATVHIACAAAAEAFVNSSSRLHLNRKYRAEFDKLSLSGKWLFFPAVLGKAKHGHGLDPGRAPLQGLLGVFKYRNALMHHKPSPETWCMGEVAPKTLKKLGLSIDEAKKAVVSTTESMQKLSGLTGNGCGMPFSGVVAEVLGFFQTSSKQHQD